MNRLNSAPGSPPECPICDSAVGFDNTSVEVSNGKIFRCQNCSGYCLYPPTHVEYTDSTWTESREAQWTADIKLAAQTVPSLLKKFESTLGRPVKSVLEIGCGSAFMGPAFREAGCSYVGTEIDKSLIKFAREKELEIMELQAEELDCDSLSGRKFDLILSANVFEHVQSPRVAFSRLEGISDGLIVIIVPNARGLYQRLRAFTPIRNLIHLVVEKRQERAFTIDGCWHNIAYTAETLKYLCDQSNLEIVESSTMSINDPVFGFVQPCLTLRYRAAAKLASMLNMESLLLLIAKPRH